MDEITRYIAPNYRKFTNDVIFWVLTEAHRANLIERQKRRQYQV